MSQPSPVAAKSRRTSALIDRIVHHADVIALKGASYRLRDRGIDPLPSIKTGQGSPD
ncbi:ATP-binding protein [Cumulibacter manganitolerans]|uniref:ATP-binding protein n=1 Tax=Cumulibacter manganitolerans TaxID=1884992 RepID=UPI002B1EE5A6|nr:ATP-binding protein [Cumulibacter manganitolerans]